MAAFLWLMHLTLAVLAAAATNCTTVIDCLCCACDASTGSLNCTGRGVTQAALLATDFLAIVGLEQVEKIYLEHNHLTAIPAGVFNSTNSLLEVHLSNNDIASIGGGAFPCNLNIAALDNNKISEMPSSPFGPPGNLTQFVSSLFFDLSFNAFVSLAGATLNYACSPFAFEGIFSLDLHNNRITSMRGFKARISVDNTFVTIDLSSNPLGALSVEDLSGLITGEVSVFNFSGCNISSIEPNAFDKFFGLNVLDLNQNALTALPMRMLAYQSALQSLDVSHNALTTLPPIKSLLYPTGGQGMKVDFSHNAIEALPAFTFADFPFPGWYFLDLSFNRMRSYANNTNQEEVQCQIQAESLQPSVRVAWDPQTPSAQYGSAQPRGRRPFFQHAVQRILALRAPGVEWPAGAGSGGRASACATRVDCSCCFCVNFTVVLGLDCSAQGVTEAVLCATDFSTSFGDVLAIALGGNAITALPEGVFAGVPHLIFLNLSSSAVASVSPRAFAGLSALEFLDVSYNQLTSLPNATFAGLPSLSTLDLSFNQLTSLPNATFAGLPSLSTLDLSYNRLASYDGAFSAANVTNAVKAESGTDELEDFTVAWNPQVGFPCRA